MNVVMHNIKGAPWEPKTHIRVLVGVAAFSLLI